MGWWKMNCKGGISSEKPTGAGDCSLVNAIPGRDTTEDHYGGDGPADIMQEAICRIIKEYRDEWGRAPYLEELDGVFSFVMGKYRHDGGIEQYEANIPPQATGDDQYPNAKE